MKLDLPVTASSTVFGLYFYGNIFPYPLPGADRFEVQLHIPATLTLDLWPCYFKLPPSGRQPPHVMPIPLKFAPVMTVTATAIFFHFVAF
jgi:hypothetical protein